MMKPNIRSATADDALSISKQLRQADCNEVVAATMRDPSWSLMRGVELGGAFVWSVDGRPCALFGSPPIAERTACVWMVSTAGLEEHSRTFLRHVRPMVDEFNEQWPLLINTADARNTLHHRLIKWCGFTFFNTRSINGLRFIDFARINSHL